MHMFPWSCVGFHRAALIVNYDLLNDIDYKYVLFVGKDLEWFSEGSKKQIGCEIGAACDVLGSLWQLVSTGRFLQSVAWLLVVCMMVDLQGIAI